MSDSSEHPKDGLEELSARLAQLEARLARVERQLVYGDAPLQSSLPNDTEIGAQTLAESGAASAAVMAESRPALEVRVGETALAWVAGAVLPAGIAFLMSHLFGRGLPLAACLTGYAAAAALFALAGTWRNTYRHVARGMEVAGVLLVFFASVRLHFFSASPLLPSRVLGGAALVLTVALLLAWAVRRQSRGRTGLCMLLAAAAALLLNAFQVTLLLVVAVSTLAVLLERRRGWIRLAVWALVLAQWSVALVMFSNPVVTGHLVAVSDRPGALGYVLALIVVFAVPSLVVRTTSTSYYAPPLLSVFNAVGGIALVALVTAASLNHAVSRTFLAASALYLVLAVAQHVRTRARLNPALYASLGFMALSVAIYAEAGVPYAFFWLALQSLLVVSMALWFRSRLLVVANSAIFLMVLALYIVLHQSSNLVNFTFAAAALVSARIMNWKKERLELHTELMRNVYLLVAFLLIPYALFHCVPRSYVSLSWVGAAVVYFALGLILHSVKYRWMAVGTLLLTVPLLLLVDVKRLEPTYRIAAFLVLGLIAVLISLFYGRIHNLVRGGAPERK